MHSDASTESQNAGSSDRRGEEWDRLLSPYPGEAGYPLLSQSLRGRRVLITGAGGSIGSALAHAAAASMPASLVLFDSSEDALYQIDRSLRSDGSREHLSILGSVCDATTVEHTMTNYQPEIIFHAAALKHVPLMELNPFAAIENNVFGTLTLLEGAAASDVQQIVLVSTDKAVEPHSIMGASKRIAELLMLRLHPSLRATVVRLCNVMGSRGSVLPLFLEQIAKGGPITVTDPEVKRYFVSLGEAVSALLSAVQVRSSQALLVPEPGPAVRIADLARHLLTLNESSAVIEFTGLRPGDKLAEQLVSTGESLSLSTEAEASALRIVETPLVETAGLNSALQTLREALARRDLQLLLHGVWELVPEYHPSSVITAALEVNHMLEPVSDVQA